jgi:hypothetical protein
MKGKIWADLAAKTMITDENISNGQCNYEHIGVENLNSRKIFHEKQRFSTAC